MQPPQYRHRPRWSEEPVYEEPQEERGLIRDISPVVFGGIMLVAAFAFAGHQIGRNASAHNAGSEFETASLMGPALPQTTTLATKGSLLPEGESFDIINLKLLRRQTVLSDGKGDLEILDPGAADDPTKIFIPSKKKSKLAAQKRIKIEPASANPGDDQSDANAIVKRLATAPAPAELEKAFKLKKAEKQKVIAQRRIRLAEENCLARAVYFEARSESEMGQLAVAKVILNRTRSPDYPKTICGVVYQGSNRRNSCQFSFACDGLPDDVKQPAAWARAKQIAQRAIAGDTNMGKAMSAATNYHADYVQPKWAKSMRKVVKIGRHVFYSGG